MFIYWNKVVRFYIDSVLVMEIIDILFKREFKCMNNIIGLLENLDIGKYVWWN